MKKIIVVICFLCLIGCKKVEDINKSDTEKYNLYCYKEYNNYEEYISIEYSDNDISYMGFSYIFDYNINNYMKKIDVNKYSNMEIKYDDTTLEYVYSDLESYINLKSELFKLLSIKEDDFSYIKDNKLNYNLFRNYINDYSCE